MKACWFFILAFLALACSSDEPQVIEDVWEDPLEGIPDKGPIRFDNPDIGQRSRYVFFQVTKKDYVSNEVTFIYRPDTLVLAIVGKEAEKFIIREFKTRGSENTSLEGDIVIRHLSVDSDSAYFSRPASPFTISWVFAGAGMNIPLGQVSEPAPLNPDCLPHFGYETSVWMQYTTNYSQFGQTFPHLNDYYDYTEMAGDGFGMMYAYGPSYGLVRWTWVNAWDQLKGEGWDLLPD